MANYGRIDFKLPEGWVVVKQHRGITTIRPVKDVNAHHVNKVEGVA